MAVRPVLLGLYEKYFLPLQKLLLPSLQAFLVGLLPGLEEGSEIYDRWVGLPSVTLGLSGPGSFCCFIGDGERSTRRVQWGGATGGPCFAFLCGLWFPGTSLCLNKRGRPKQSD